MINPLILLYPFFWLGIIIVIGYGFSLLYHWIRFGHMYPLVWLVLPVYVVGSLIFIGAMLSGLAAV